ncbi:amidohydrolase family protein [Faecalispora anaeroviscerum]|uniref:amidohydrolase family protein n=1 Tax=Faecalispora anaeroviscerum TaxID=2991836 RepID=UPI0024BBB1A4|nr:amidohydrolase family protein [Faecalispora anaeroviscerum]
MTYLHASRAITGDGKTVLSPAWIGFDGKFITYVDSQKPGDATPENTEEFDASVTLTPGLMNIHDHISRKSLRFPTPGKTFGECATKLMANDQPYLILHSYVNMLSYLKDEGITYVRDQGLTGYTCINLRQAINEGLVMGPYISTCGMSLSITGGHCYRQSMECDGPDAVRRAVRIQCNKGADIIKFMGSGGLEHFPEEDPSIPQFTLEELRAGADAAHDLGRDCAIHAYSNEGIRRAVFAGIDHIEHGCMMSEDLIEEMAKRRTHLNPTMTGIRGAAKAGPNAKYWDMLQERVFSKQEQGMRWAKAAGILIGAGTDTAGTLRDEIAMIADTLGEGSVEAIGRATGTNAKIAKRDDMGLLEVGRIANIAAFDGDLTKSLDGLAHVTQTWKDGIPCK